MAERICSIDDCGRKHEARGWCKQHYRRWKKYGDPLRVLVIVDDDESRFWQKVDKRGPDDCWPWLGFITPFGYGDFWFCGRNTHAHRAAYELLVGPIPEGLQIDHLCHTEDPCTAGNRCAHRRCVNIAHLEVVTKHQNILRGLSHAGVNARKTHCIRGHEFTPENTYIPPKRPTSRFCRKCAALHQKKYQARAS